MLSCSRGKGLGPDFRPPDLVAQIILRMRTAMICRWRTSMAWRHSSICPRQAQPSLLLPSSRQPSLTLTSQNAWPSCVASEQEGWRELRVRICSSEHGCAHFLHIRSEHQQQITRKGQWSVVHRVLRVSQYDVMHSC